MSCFHTYESSAKTSFKLPKDYFIVRKNSSILSDKIIARLRAIDPLLIGDAKDGKQRISLGLIGPSSLSSRSGTPASATSTPISYMTIPTNYESIAIFEFLGFTPQAAVELWEKRMVVINCRQADPPNIGGFDAFEDPPTDMYDWVMNRVKGGIWGEIACPGNADDWDQAMAEMGLNGEIRAAFAKPSHSNILLI
jgi:hypothetical protein